MQKYLLFLTFFIGFTSCQSAQKPSQYDYKWVILPQYESGFGFKHGVAFVKQGGQYGLIDTTGKWLMPPQFNGPCFFDAETGLAVAQQGDKMGFIDTLGRWAIPAQFSYATSFRQGFASVKLASGKWTFINQWTLKPMSNLFDHANEFSEGLASAEQAGQWGLIDTTGKWVLMPQFEQLTTFKGGMIGAKFKGKWGFIDKAGKTVIPFQYEEDALSLFGFYKGYTLLKQGDKRCVLNLKNQIITAPEYDVKGFYGTNMLFPAQKNNLYGVLDTSGKVVIPFEYDKIYSLTEGLIQVVQKGKYGFVDTTGNVVIPIIYDFALECQEGFISVRIGDRYGVIDKKANIVISPSFALVDKVSQGFIGIQQGDKYGYIQLRAKK